MEFNDRDDVYRSAYALLSQVPLKKWDPFEWCMDYDTLRNVQRWDWNFSLTQDRDKYVWIEGLPVRVMRIEPTDKEFYKIVDVPLGQQVATHDPVVFSLCCKGRRTGRLYWIDDSRCDQTVFNERNDTLTVKVT